MAAPGCPIRRSTGSSGSAVTARPPSTRSGTPPMGRGPRRLWLLAPVRDRNGPLAGRAMARRASVRPQVSFGGARPSSPGAARGRGLGPRRSPRRRGRRARRRPRGGGELRLAAGRAGPERVRGRAPGVAPLPSDEGPVPVGGGAAYEAGGTLWLGFGGVLATHRRRGGQAALLARRIEDAACDCHTAIVDAAEGSSSTATACARASWRSASGRSTRPRRGVASSTACSACGGNAHACCLRSNDRRGLTLDVRCMLVASLRPLLVKTASPSRASASDSFALRGDNSA